MELLLDRETLRFIFGLKLRKLRQEVGLTPKDLASKSGLSISYISEIEKGKKYPRSEKIMMLAKSLGVAYDDLISLRLGEEMSALAGLLQNNFFKGIPYEIFGVHAQSLFELMAENPQKVSALVGTLFELARTSKIRVEDFFYASLRAYLDLNHNYFPQVEKSVEDFLRKHLDSHVSSQSLTGVLEDRFGYRILDWNPGPESQAARMTPYYYYEKDKPTLLVNSRISERERTFILAKEVAFPILGLSERYSSSLSTRCDSFEVVFNNFKGSYFASALCIPREGFLASLRDFFAKKDFDHSYFSEWLKSYPGNYEAFFHRISQLLPNFFKINQLFLLQFNFDTRTYKFHLHRELHLSQLHTPHEVKTGEHYCRRWITLSLVEKLTKGGSGNDFEIGIQKSHFMDSDKEYLCISLARHHDTDPHTVQCTTLGILIDDNTRSTIQFLDSDAIRRRLVNGTCEKCSIQGCEERAAESFLFQRDKEKHLAYEELQNLIGSDKLPS